jgi:epoxyqueuosine reductase
LQKLCDRIEKAVGPFGYRAFADSAPVLEVELAAKAGSAGAARTRCCFPRDAGSYFFLGEIYTSLPLPADAAARALRHVPACIDVCPTQAIRAPYELDARRCISYLTIEHKSAIPEASAAADRQSRVRVRRLPVFCPWNSFAQRSPEDDFRVRNGLDRATLVDLFAWTGRSSI